MALRVVIQLALRLDRQNLDALLDRPEAVERKIARSPLGYHELTQIVTCDSANERMLCEHLDRGANCVRCRQRPGRIGLSECFEHPGQMAQRSRGIDYCCHGLGTATFSPLARRSSQA